MMLFGWDYPWRLRLCAFISQEAENREKSLMTAFDERKNAFEKKFAHDEELRFKATARRNKLFGLWAAAQLGKVGAEAEEYAKSVILADFQEAGDADVIRKVRADLEAAGKPVQESELNGILQAQMARAVDEIQAGR